MADHDMRRVMGVLIHGDAAFCGQAPAAGGWRLLVWVNPPSGFVGVGYGFGR